MHPKFPTPFRSRTVAQSSAAMAVLLLLATAALGQNKSNRYNPPPARSSPSYRPPARQAPTRMRNAATARPARPPFSNRQIPSSSTNQPIRGPRTPYNFQGSVPAQSLDSQRPRLSENTNRPMSFASGTPASRQSPDRNSSRFVHEASGRGYVQRPFAAAGHQYIHRTYSVGGHRFVRVYRPYYYHGFLYDIYAPLFYYQPAFYAYVCHPWLSPVVYRWGWLGDPWYAFYAPVFSPYHVYSSPGFWLTDYLIANSLSAAYREQTSQPQVALDAPAMSPPLKQAIADEVQRQLQQHQQSEQSPQPDPNLNGVTLPIFDNNPHTLLVSSVLSVNAGARQCTISQGDLLQFDGTPQYGVDNTAAVKVAWSKGQDCRPGSVVSVPIDQLQEMQNQMRAAIDQGLGDLQANQGRNGLAKIPDNLLGSTPSEFASQVPPPDSNLTAPTVSPENGPAYSANVAAGQSSAQVIAILGAPLDVANVGSKSVFVYRSLKITFIDDKLVDVQ